MTNLPIIADDIAADAQHGTFCPKMCSFLCPVTTATGRDDALPWSFHRTVDDLAKGRLDPAHVDGRLDACSGCYACQVACEFDQDVPAQVRAARSAVVEAGHAAEHTEEAVAAVQQGRSPFGTPRLSSPPGSSDAPVAVLTGCRDDQESLRALQRLLDAAGVEARFVVPAGCCGSVLDDLGARDAAAAQVAALREPLAGATTIVALDPHCLPSIRAVDDRADVVDVTTYLAGLLDAGSLTLDGGLGPVTYHDPCLLAREEGVVDPPRRLLEAAGASLTEPEGSRERTFCSGGGLGMELAAPDEAARVAGFRGTQLAATGTPVVTACAGARRRLGASGLGVVDLVTLLADHLA